MISIFLSILVGILIGYLLKNYSIIKHSNKLLNIVIMLLLFFLGVSVGNNKDIINNFMSIGIEAFILTVGGTLGSLICAKFIYNRYFKKRSNIHSNIHENEILNEQTDSSSANIKSEIQ